jgi:hypothetical protein
LRRDNSPFTPARLDNQRDINRCYEERESAHRAEAGRQLGIVRQREAEIQAQRDKEKKIEDDRLALIAAKQAVIDQQRREVEEKEREEMQKREQEAYLELQRQRDLENQACESYKKKHCQVLTSQTCVPMKRCQDAVGKRVCWEEQSCSSNSRTVCGGKRPVGCSTQ